MQHRFDVAPEPCDLTALLQQVIALVQPQVAAKGLRLEADLQPCPAPLSLDSTRMSQVIANLLSNAIKFTPSGGTITVRLLDAPTQVQIQVSDTGQGILAERLPYIFERFWQADSSNTRPAGGLGLGLFLVKSIVEAHGGTVTAHSPGVGQGATFTITLAKAIAAPTQPTPPAPETALDLGGIRILLVEDDALASAAIAFALRHFGAIVTTAQSAAEALDRLTQELPNLIVSDIGLPNVNGYDLIRQIRALPPERGGQLPAIALSGYADQQSANAALEAGFQAHLSKPVDNHKLIAQISSLVRG